MWAGRLRILNCDVGEPFRVQELRGRQVDRLAGLSEYPALQIEFEVAGPQRPGAL